jgi:lipopolysaccharide transport system permease protein
MKKTLKIYKSTSSLRDPILLVKDMVEDFKKSIPLAWRLMKRDLNARYRQTFFGYFWALIPPVVVAYGLVFAAKAKVVNMGVTDLPYPAYVMLSMVLWQTFLDSFNGPLSAVIESKSMLAKINFPRESIILAKIGEVVFNFLIKLILIFFVFITYDISITKMAFFAPFGVLSLIFLGTFLGLLIAPLGAIYQDVSRTIILITTPWFLITPVLYSPPENGFFSVIVKLNPVTNLLVTTRELITTGLVSNLSGFLIVSVSSVLGLLVTWVIFRLAIPFVIERMPS